MQEVIRRMRESDIARFWSYVDIREPDECWPWKPIKADNKFRYGSFYLLGTKVKAHQVANFLDKGWPDPSNLLSLHDCDNPPCCNGRHLFYGTDKDNAVDMAKKGRSAAQIYPGIRRGSRNSLAVLTEETVRLIKRSDLSQRHLALIYKVHYSTISKIKTGINWSHV